MRRLARRLLRAVAIIVAIVLLIPVLGFAYGYATAGSPVGGPLPAIALDEPSRAVATSIRQDIADYSRPEASTYLTYPEWAIVYAAREYSAVVNAGAPHGFPYWAYVGRYWQDYVAMIGATRNHPFNFENHLMLVVIGVSHTVEHIIQWAYENTVGRATFAIAGGPVEQDRFLARNAAEYAAFLDQVPWYAYPYARQRAALGAIGSAPGAASVRSWERRLAFGAALWIKQAYANLISSGLDATSAPAALEIHVWARGPVATAIEAEPGTRLVADYGSEGAVFVTRRYQAFTELVPRLVGRGVSFVEIAGNDEILVTVLSPDLIAAPGFSRVLFSYALPVEPQTRRTGLAVSVRNMHETLRTLLVAGIRLEHIYDY